MRNLKYRCCDVSSVRGCEARVWLHAKTCDDVVKALLGELIENCPDSSLQELFDRLASEYKCFWALIGQPVRNALSDIRRILSRGLDESEKFERDVFEHFVFRLKQSPWLVITPKRDSNAVFEDKSYANVVNDLFVKCCMGLCWASAGTVDTANETVPSRDETPTTRRRPFRVSLTNRSCD